MIIPTVFDHFLLPPELKYISRTTKVKKEAYNVVLRNKHYRLRLQELKLSLLTCLIIYRTLSDMLSLWTKSFHKVSVLSAQGSLPRLCLLSSITCSLTIVIKNSSLQILQYSGTLILTMSGVTRKSL